MGLLFKNDLHDEFGTWPLGYIPYGGADFGEVRAVGAAVGDGDDEAFCDAWCAAGDRLAGEAADDEAAGRRASARDGWLRAACFYGAAYHPIFGAPVNPRLLAAFRKQITAFDRGLALGEPAVMPMGIALGDLTMPAYLLRAEGRADETRPLLILTNGYDGTVTDMYFASAVAAARRGYHVLFFDGPGQGGPLYEQGVPMRPDWETVITAVVDAALELPGIDPKRVALSGWSLGGHLAARAATGRAPAGGADPRPGALEHAGGLHAPRGQAGHCAGRLDRHRPDRRRGRRQAERGDRGQSRSCAGASCSAASGCTG